MAYAVNHFPADGNTRLFQIDFDYLSKDHVSVLVDGESVAFTFNDTYTIDITSGAPLAGSIIEVRRVTPLDKRLVDFQDGSVFAESDLDMMNLQLLYVSQEAVDKTESAMIEGSTGELDALGRQIKNLKTPTADADAATKAYVDTGVVAHVQAASVERQAAEVARADAEAAAQTTATATTALLASHVQESQGARAGAELAVTEAQAARAGAEVARDQVLALYDEFDDRYLGVKASDPTTDNDGNPLFPGALYFQQVEAGTEGVMKVYTGTFWVAAYVNGSSILTVANFLALLASLSPENQVEVRAGVGAAAVEDLESLSSRALRASRITFNAISR